MEFPGKSVPPALFSLGGALRAPLDTRLNPAVSRDTRRKPPVGATARSPPSGVHRKGAGCARQLHEGSMRVDEGFSGVYSWGVEEAATRFVEGFMWDPTST